jgi:hypothetical protein
LGTGTSTNAREERALKLFLPLLAMLLALATAAAVLWARAGNESMSAGRVDGDEVVAWSGSLSVLRLRRGRTLGLSTADTTDGKSCLPRVE